MKSILFCSSKYGKRFYMLGCKWRAAGRVPLMTISELKIMLGLKDPKGIQKEQYQRWNDLKKDVLDVGFKQVNENSDIVMTYRLIKKGRSFHWIEILIGHKAEHQLEIAYNKSIPEQLNIIPIEGQKSTQTIIKYGFSEAQAVAIAKHGYKEFEKIKDKKMPELNSGKMTHEQFINYIVSVYKKKKVL